MAPVVAGDPEGEAQKKDPEAERKEAESVANPKEAERKPEVEALKGDEKKMASQEGKKEGHERKEEECRGPTEKALAEIALNRLSTEDLSQQGGVPPIQAVHVHAQPSPLEVPSELGEGMPGAEDLDEAANQVLSEEQRKLRCRQIAKFWRSVKSRSCPEEIRLAALKIRARRVLSSVDWKDK